MTNTQDEFARTAPGRFWDSVRRSRPDQWAAGIIGLGGLARLKYYFAGCPVWIDEAWASVSIAGRTWREIVHGKPFASDTATPPAGFALIEKLFLEWGGYQEWALRFFPLLCGIGSLLIFWHILRRIVSPRIALTALGLLAFSEPAIFYAVTIKQYAADCFFALLLLDIALVIAEKGMTGRRSVVLALTGGMAAWISNALIFVQGAVILTLGFRMLRSRRWNDWGGLALTGLVWLASFAWLYKTSLGPMSHRQELFNMWKGFFTGLPSTPLAFFPWLARVMSDALADPLSLMWPYAGLAVWVIGTVRQWKQSKTVFFLFLLPLILALSAGLLHKYPFRNRLLLFAMGPLALFTAQGAAVLAGMFQGRWRVAGGAAVGLLIFIGPLWHTGTGLAHGRCFDDMRSATAYYLENKQEKDFVMINDFALPQFWFYLAGLGRDARTSQVYYPPGLQSDEEAYVVRQTGSVVRQDRKGRYVYVRDVLGVYNQQEGRILRFYSHPSTVDQIRESTLMVFPHSRRVWLILSTFESGLDEFLVTRFDRQYRRLDQLESRGTRLYLYDTGTLTAKD